MKSLTQPLQLFGFCLISLVSSAQWNPDPTLNAPVSVATNWQIDLRMMEDDQGGAFLVWKDYRNGTPDIFAQHIDSNGVCLWQVDGAPVCTQSADQSTPGLISDGAGGIIVSWSDWRSGIERDIYAQRLNPQGQPIWPLDGIVVVNKPNREHNQRMVMDGQGGAIVVFEQKNSATYYWEIWAQRINADGNVVWTPGGIPLTGVLSEHLNERIQGDGQGGVYVTFQDFRNGVDHDVYVQHLGPNGEYLWGTGVLACNVPGTQTNPKIDPDYATGGVIVSWTDKRNGLDYDIFAQRIAPSGQLLWGAGGKPVCVSAGNQSAIDLLGNASVEGCIFTWKDDRSGNGYDIYMDKLDVNGNSVWVQNGFSVCSDVGDQLNPNITGDGYGGAVVVWQDGANGDFDIRAQHVYKEGIVHYPGFGVWLGTATGIQTSPKSCSDTQGNGIFAWEDSRSGTPDIFCTRLSWGGPLVGIKESIFSDAHCYPNPMEESLTIENVNGIQSVVLLDNQGKSVKQLNGMGKTKCQLDVAFLTPGIYFVQVMGHDGELEMQKVIK
jgi:Secretion system C-terminal sorting domain